MSKLLGNINELDNTSPRVRAYSVGSKSKIPRCDIQRGVLFSKLTNGHHHKGSICNVDVQTCSEIIGLNTPKEIKSTSAPLLNLRNYISPVRMSDLMEIDFSHVTQVSTTSQQQRMFKNCEVPVMQNETLAQKRIASDNPNSYGNIKRTEMNQQSDLTSKYKVKKCGENSDTGYLEMKPVGKVYPNFKQLSLDDQMEKLRLQNQCLRLGAMQDEPNNSGCCVMSERNGDLKESQHTTNINIYNAENLDKSFLTSEEHTKLEKNKKENAILNCGLDIGNAATVGRKLIHSISNEDYTKHVNKSNAYDTKEVGYQILQIKSDSSLISKKKNQRPSYKQQISRQIHLEGLKKVDGNEAILNTPTKCKLLNEKESNVLNEGVSEHILDQDATGLSSGLCEYELYYASLDLPQCSGQMATNSLKKVSCESSPTPICFESNSSYAKIDFDQSDSSSASSKICNI